MGRNSPARYLLLLSLLALLGVVLLYPIWLTVRGAPSESQNFVIADPDPCPFSRA